MPRCSQLQHFEVTCGHSTIKPVLSILLKDGIYLWGGIQSMEQVANRLTQKQESWTPAPSTGMAPTQPPCFFSAPEKL